MPSQPTSTRETCKIFIFYTVNQPDITIVFCVPGDYFFQPVIFNITVKIAEYRLGTRNACTDSSVRINPGKAELYACVCSATRSIISNMGERIVEVLYGILDLLIGYQ